MSCGHNCGCHNCSNGLGAYGAVPPLAQSGFRLSIPGGPRGGQFHGITDANPINPAYRGGRVRNLSGRPHPAMVDPFHRAPGELVPRPNAAGDLNITGIDHEPASPGFAMVPGGLFPVGGFGVGYLGARLPVVASKTPMHSIIPPEPVIPPVTGVVTSHPQFRLVPPQSSPPYMPPGVNIPTLPCPPGYHSYTPPPPNCPPGSPCPQIMFAPICQPNTTVVGPPSGGTQPAPVVADGCPPNWYRDAAGNCTNDWSHPYPVTLPAQPSPTVPADTSGTPSAGQTGCISGQFDASGNCIPSTVPGATGDWLTDPTQEVIPGVPNWGLLAGGAVAAYLLFGHKGRR